MKAALHIIMDSAIDDILHSVTHAFMSTNPPVPLNTGSSRNINRAARILQGPADTQRPRAATSQEGP